MPYNIYSIGHSNKPLDAFIKELKENRIDTVVDLRTSPYSSYSPHFNRDKLKPGLEDEDIEYIYFGDKLGGRPPEGIDAFRHLVKFKENVTELLSVVDGKNAALMCSEADYTQCHRRFIIEEIKNRQIDVTIIGKALEKVKKEKIKEKSKQIKLEEF